MEAIQRNLLDQVVREAAREVFSTMLGMELSCGEAHTEKLPPATAEGVVSLIGLAGRWVGTGCVCYSASFACRICSQMLLGQFEVVGEEVLDVVAELTNMIIGNVKTGLEEQFGPMGLSIPTVVFGKNFTTKSACEGEWTVFPFFHGEDRLDVKICLVPSRKPIGQIRPAFPHTCSLEG